MDDFVAEATAWPLPGRRAIRLIADPLERLAGALDSVDRTAYPGYLMPHGKS